MMNSSDNNKSNNTQGSSMKAFIAYMLPLDTAATLHKKVRRFDLVRDEQHVRWVPPQNYHLTLRFLGDCSTEQLQGVTSQLQRHLSDFQSFVCMSGGVEYLPNRNHPRLMTLKIHSGRRMDDLHNVCESIAEQHGFPEDQRAFRPHVTLARARRFEVEQGNSRAPEPAGLLHVPGRIPGYRLRVGEVALVASELHPDGPRYKVLESFPLS